MLGIFSAVAAFEDREEPCQLYVKAQGKLYVTELGQSPLDVAHGTDILPPAKYDLRRFSPVVRFYSPSGRHLYGF